VGGPGRMDRIEGLTMALLRPAFPQPFAADAAASCAVICKKREKNTEIGKWKVERVELVVAEG